MRILKFLSLLMVGMAASATQYSVAQVPDTEIVLVPLARAGNSWALGEPHNVTNREGYDNQPAFSRESDYFLYSAIGEDGQADVYRYDLSTQSTVQLTHTAESEYSPTPLPFGKGFSCVVVEKDSSQRLWEYADDGTPRAPVFSEIDQVGYHAWIDDLNVALFRLPEPFSLEIANLKTGERQVITENIGRCLRPHPQNTSLDFVAKLSPETFLIKNYNPETHTISQVMVCKEGVEDFARLPDGTLIMGKDSRLYMHDPKRGGPWVEIMDFAGTAAEGFYRIAVAPNGKMIALVTQ